MGSWHSKLNEPRMGIMLHYDASASDQGAVRWLTKDPRCNVSYNWIVLDNGQIVAIAPESARAWHAGVCQTSDPVRLPYRDANSAFYGIAAAAKAGDTITPAQFTSITLLVRRLLAKHGWQSETFRIVGHDTECAPRGRKHDPTGPDPAKPVLSVTSVRETVSR